MPAWICGRILRRACGNNAGTAGTDTDRGLFMEIPEGYEVQVRARSGLAVKHGIGLDQRYWNHRQRLPRRSKDPTDQLGRRTFC